LFWGVFSLDCREDLLKQGRYRMSKLVPVILSGGMGTRLWPLSRGNHPKQFLKLSRPDRNLIQETLLRVADREQFAPPIMVCNQQHRFLIAETLREIGVEDATILLEPCGKNTAPALAAAAHLVRETYGGNALMLVLPSDHIITEARAFREGVGRAQAIAAKGYLTTFGIAPKTPETGYGYIKLGKEISEKESSYGVAKFVEKPDEATALGYLEKGGYLWNSGMFCFPAELFLGELARFRPEMAALAEQATLSRREDEDFLRLDAAAFSRITSDSIDYAVMEHTDKAAVVTLDCGWTDAGSFEALWEMHEKNEEGNVISGETHLLDTRGCYISCNDGVQVAALGIRDLVIVSTKDCIMVADRNRTQEVKELVAQVKTKNPDLIEEYRQSFRPWGNFDNIDAGNRYRVKRITVKPGGACHCRCTIIGQSTGW
jgi:mannose-1-phosphate guanylyltransferase / mannose-6-phosphate isomerase